MREPKVAFCCILRTDDGIFLRLPSALLLEKDTQIPDELIKDYLVRTVRKNSDARKIPDNEIAELRLIVVGKNDEEFTQVLDPLDFWPIIATQEYADLYAKYRGVLYRDEL